jgi:SSS family solute:Na+ symporter
METVGPSLGLGGILFVAAYLLSTIFIGWLARKRRQNDSLADFYLAGRSMGVAVLFLTLYATQYSGNTMFGYAGRAYQIGFGWMVSALFMFSIIVGYLLFAPRLVVLARLKAFITPGDFISYRFGSKALTLLATLLMIYALANYTLAQLKAMGAAVEGITSGAVPSAYGIVGLAVIMVIYETLGGMRSVAWTDVIQGVVLLIGFAILLFVIPGLGGGLAAVVEEVSRIAPEKVIAPSAEACTTWISYLILIGCGAAIYPQAIQRLYSSRSVTAIKRSFTFMAFMPLTTSLIAVLCGITGIVVLPELAAAETDQVLPRLCALVMNESLLGYWLIVVVFAAALAALMSTADSALLAISSMITRDIYQAHFRPGADEAELTWIGKICSWIAVAILVVVAIGTEKSLVRLLELKFEVLVQIAPCFFLGLYWRSLSAPTVVTGILVGIGLALGLTLFGQTRVFGFHAGVVGLAANVAVCAVGSSYCWFAARRASGAAGAPETDAAVFFVR